MKKLSTLLLVSLMVLASACSKPTEQPAGACTAGTYTATEKGFGGDITVEVTELMSLSDDIIAEASFKLE